MAPEPPKLRSQLLTWLLIPLFLLLALDLLASSWMATKFSQRAYDRSLLEIARELSLHLAGGEDNPRFDLSAEARAILLSDPDDRIRYQLAAADGRHVEGDLLPAAQAPAAPGTPAFFDAVVGGEEVRVAELHLPRNGAGVGAAVVRVAETVGKRNLLAREIILSALAPQALLILVAGLVVWLGVVHGLSPLERLRRTVMSRTHDDRSPIRADDVPAEVRPLLEAINELVARLDHAFEVQGRFIGDAAHQLKTPVAVLKTELELALREDDPASARHAMLNSRAALERLSRVVSQLLSLARNDAGAVQLAPVDLNALALDVSRSWVPRALGKRIDLGFEAAPGPLEVPGDAARLREMLDNLVDNALRYTPAGGSVTVRVDGRPVPRVEVRDDGPRIPAEERTRVFERFHRLLGNNEEGSGLGLAIAREIARLHGAVIELGDDEDGTGNCFRVIFPPS